MKDICEDCGSTWDVREWVRCPICAKKKFRDKYPQPSDPFWRRVQFWSKK